MTIDLVDDRADREATTRDAESRETPWAPPSALPDPHPRIDLVHRWIRTSSAGQADPTNVSNSFREGWVPVKASEYPEMNVLSDTGSRWPDGIEIGGLLLCAAPAKTMQQRREYYMRMTRTQMKSVNDQLSKEEDPRFRTLWREHSSSVSRGSGPRAVWPKP